MLLLFQQIKQVVVKMDLKAKRKAKGLRQTDLAQAAQISQSLVTLIESGIRKPSVKVAKRIAAVLGFDWTEFFKETA